MTAPYSVKTFIKHTFAQRFRLARLTHVPALGRLVDRLLFSGDELFYLPSDRTIAIDRPLAGRDDMAVPSDVLVHFINASPHRWQMDFCICRTSDRCSDYPPELGCLFLGEAAMHINPKFGRTVSRTEALRHARQCREAGLVHLIGRNKLDAVWLGVSPPPKLLTICNCCPCCCLWKILPSLTPQIGAKVHRMPGVIVRVGQACTGCGTCIRNGCFAGAIRIEDDRARIGPECRGCARCADSCPQKAIEVEIADPAYIRQTIQRISTTVEID